MPLTDRLAERLCGVWVVDLVTGQIVGFLRFEELVQEVFDVAGAAGRALSRDRRGGLGRRHELVHAARRRHHISR